MPVSRTSRYARLAPYRAFAPDGQAQATIPLRPQPTPVSEGIYEHVITGVETLEYLAWRHYGLSEFWWRIADANPRVFPLDVRTGATVGVPSPASFGLTLRERSFG